MSEEEKQQLLSKDEEEFAEEVPRPEVPIVDYSKKNFYDHLNLKNDASMETIKSTYAELAKKYNPVTNPDEIDRYQNISRAGYYLSNEKFKNFYDDFGDLSLLLCEIFQHFFPYVVEEKPKDYLYTGLFSIFFIIVLVVVQLVVGISKYQNSVSFSWTITFIPTILICASYLLYVFYRHRKDKKNLSYYGDKKEESLKFINKRNGMSALKGILLLLLPFTLSAYFNRDKGCIYLYCIPYFIVEAINLYQDALKFIEGSNAIKSGKESNSFSLKRNNYLKYLIGISNAKCEKNKEGKKEGCANCAVGYFFFHVFKTDIIRLIQNTLLLTALNIKSSNYAIYFLPSLLILVASIAEIVIQGKIGYVRGTNESVLAYIMVFVYFLIIFDLVFLFSCYCYFGVMTISHNFPFIVELIFLAGGLTGVLPFVPIMEFKMKHEESDVPI